MKTDNQHLPRDLEDSIFNSLSPQALHRLNQVKIHSHFKRGEIIYHQDAPCFGIYCIESGMVKCFTYQEDGKELIHRLARKGHCIGHTSIYGRNSYFESTRSLEETHCSFIEGQFVKELADTEPLFRKKLLDTFSCELQDSYARNLEIVRKNVRERMALFFLKMSSAGEKIKHTQIQLSREEIASFIGSANESVIRCISEFKELGYIEERNRTFYITNEEKLLALSGFEKGSFSHFIQ